MSCINQKPQEGSSKFYIIIGAAVFLILIASAVFWVYLNRYQDSYKSLYKPAYLSLGGKYCIEGDKKLMPGEMHFAQDGCIVCVCSESDLLVYCTRNTERPVCISDGEDFEEGEPVFVYEGDYEAEDDEEIEILTEE